ncbi:MAG: septum formation initiator family protein [Duncaniella sp.]|nr:septum formation initiator family protein [Duncaniella sp.]
MNDFINWCRRYLSFTLLGALIVLAIVLFFNENSLVRTIDQEQRIDELQALIEEANDTLTYYRDLNRQLNTSRETMERIVREQHHMQHPDEDVYIFE